VRGLCYKTVNVGGDQEYVESTMIAMVIYIEMDFNLHEIVSAARVIFV